MFSAEVYQNDVDQPLNFECKSKTALSEIRSVYSTSARDRQFQFNCRKTVSKDFSKCFWTDNVNDFDEPLLFQCPANYVMSGVKSVHHNGREDREWRFKCCKTRHYSTRNCELTDFINVYRSHFNYIAPRNKVFVGAFSFHDNHQE